MAGISAAQVKALREETGLPMMECKTALSEANGDTEEAKLLLEKKFKGKMSSRASKETGEGRIAFYIAEDRKSGAIIELCCETAPVAKTERFVQLVDCIARSVARQDAMKPTVEEVKGFTSETGKTVADEMAGAFALVQENMNLTRCRKVTGEYLCGYVHHDGKSGVLIALDAAPGEESVAVDLCHHVTFTNPAAITRADISADDIEKVRRLAREVAEGEGKPPQIIEKIVVGKVNAFCADNALMEQEHVKVSKTKVGDVLKKAGVNAVTDLVSFKIG